VFHILLTIKCMLAGFVNLRDIYAVYISPTLTGENILGGKGNCPVGNCPGVGNMSAGYVLHSLGM